MTTAATWLAAIVWAGPTGGPEEIGLWEPPQKWPAIAIHAAMLPSGKVLHYSYPTGTDGSTAIVWDPQTFLFTPVTFPGNIFCSGLSMLPDGLLLVTGGTLEGCHFRGRPSASAFDPFSETWVGVGPMADGRWYPTNTLLGDGSTLILSGLNLVCETNPLMERYYPGFGIALVPGGTLGMSLFPRAHLLTSGRVARVGPEMQTLAFDPDAGSWSFVDFSNFGTRCEGTSVLIPGRTDEILIVGGNCPVTGTAEIIDFKSLDPHWQYTNPMNHPRAHADALILPDATVMVVGGGTMELYEQPVLIPELFDPVDETWTELAPHTYGRMYHATTVLLPDGRVLLAGQDFDLSSFSAEIYYPPYLFRGPRPAIDASPQRISYGRPFSVGTTQAGAIGAAALVAPSTVTHSVNTTQRYVGLELEVLGAGALRVTPPPGGNHAPPMYYMLFILDGDGVPSIASWVRLGDFGQGDVDGDGVTGIVDLLTVLAEWGPCPGCDTDLDGDAVTGVLDFLAVLEGWG